IRAAQDAHRTLRTKLASLDEADVAEEIQAELPTLSAKVEPLAGRSMPLTKQDITDLGPALLRADETLAAWDSQLESAVKHVYAVRQDLRRMDTTWSGTEALAKEEGAPPPVLDRIATVRREVQSASTETQRRLDRLLATQDNLPSLRLPIDDTLVAVKKARELEAEQLFEIGSVPLWDLLSRPLHGERVREQIVQALRMHATTLREFLEGSGGPVLLLLGLWVILGIALWRGRRRVIPEVATDPEAASGARVLLHPFASPGLLTLVLAVLLLRPRPLVVSQLLLLGMLGTALAAASSLIPPKARRSTYSLAIIVAVHLLSSLAPEHSLLRRMLLLAVSLSAAGVMGGTLLRREWETAIAGRRRRSLLRAALVFGGLLLLTAAVADLLGNVKLAQVLTTATLASVAMLLVLAGLLAVVRGLLAIALRSTWVKHWPVVGNHAEL